MPFKKPHQTAENNSVNIKQIPNGWEIMPKGLNIIWGNDLRYWKTITNEGAELIQVSWLEVSGKVGPVHVGEEYKVKFHIEVKDTGFGWTGTEVLVMAKIGKKGPYKYKSVKLACPDRGSCIPKEDDELKISVERKEGESEKDLDLHFGLYEVWSGKWKGGLIIKKAEIIKT